MGDEVDDDNDAVDGRDRVPNPRFVAPSFFGDASIIVCIERRRWLAPIVVNILEQVMIIVLISCRLERLVAAVSIGSVLSTVSSEFDCFPRQSQP